VFTSNYLSFFNVLIALGQLEKIQSNPSYLEYVTSNESYINTEEFVSKTPSRTDIENHINIVKALLTDSFSTETKTFSHSESVLLTTLCSYLTEETHRLRSKSILKCLEKLSSTWTQEHLKHFLTILYAKAALHSEKPVKFYTKEEEEPPLKQSNNLSTRLMTIFKITCKSCLENIEDLPEEQLFQSMVRIVCHPLVSGNYKDLKVNFGEFGALLGGEEKINQLFERS
jgi:hypothetical protein